ncbi:sensor histidine kinase [Hymenobacter arizonensis]|uniref:histidine kinase n=1 Tax=Hymenobacter arizonensis TaxID=1227077 RepID=A0A1I5ZAU4_HYMAR|nr:ATP-binding protein [Hymenobacter arizonensis]SFQ53553.1 Signal transduction histidine kinase [Hymenobacter arizonensis]
MLSSLFGTSTSPLASAGSHEQVRQQNQVLTAVNDALNTANEGLFTSNAELQHDQSALQAHNLNLEAQVLASAQVALAAQTEAGHQRASLERFLGQTRAAVCILRGTTHQLDYANPAFQELFPGHTLPLGQSVADWYPETVALGLVGRLDGVYRSGTSYFGVETPLTLAPPAGEAARTRYFTFSCDAYHEHGHVVGVSLFAYDVTEAVLARRLNETLQAEALAATQRQLHEREAFHQVFEQTPALLTLLRGPEHRFEYCNAAQERVFPGRQLLGQPLATVLPDAATQGFVALLDQVYATGKPGAGVEVPADLDQLDGQPAKRHYFNFTYHRFEEGGQPAGISVFGTDVTEQVNTRQQLAQANAELTTANAQLTRTNADLDTFVYTASHDLKAPISNLEGLLYALNEELPAAAKQAGQVPAMLERMQLAVDRFKLTIAQLTDVSRIQRAHTQPAATVDLATLVEDIRLDLGAVLVAAEARIEVEVATCPSISFAPQNLRSIVYNLLSNAVKYQRPGCPPEVRLRCRSTGTTIVLDVQDNGLGLSEGQQGQLFGLFSRLHDHVEGSGIGLYMVKRMVENAGGTIAVQSELGVGTTFTITLPAPA